MSSARVVPTIRPVSRDEADEWFGVDQWAFAFDDTGVDDGPATELLPWDRAFAATLDGSSEMAAIYAAFSLELTVPGGSAPGAPVRCAGLTWVGVHPQHRRRGLLTAMIDHHLADVRDTGEPVSALYAAEPAIYGRFGYGLASRTASFSIGRGAAMRDVPGADVLVARIEKADAARHAPVVQEVREAHRVHRPGEMDRPTPGHQRDVFTDHKAWRAGAEPLRIAVVEDDDGRPRGYAVFRRKADWGEGGPTGQVRVKELTALDAAAARRLWGLLADLDLMATLSTDGRPLDDPLFSLLVDVRATTPKVSDNLWVRVVDVAAALEARRWTADVDVVLEVSDPRLASNAGRWHLRGSRTTSTCTRTDAPADLVLDVRELGAAYLGGTTLVQLADAGLVVPTSRAALLDASAAFASPVAPSCGFMF